MVKTGNYWLIAFDKFGRRDKRFDLEEASLGVCQARGNYLVSHGEIHSFAVARLLYNSVDEARERWE